MGSFILDTSTLGGIAFTYNETIISGRGRTISLDWTNDEINQVFGITGYSIRYYPAEAEPKENV